MRFDTLWHKLDVDLFPRHWKVLILFTQRIFLKVTYENSRRCVPKDCTEYCVLCYSYLNRLSFEEDPCCLDFGWIGVMHFSCTNVQSNTLINGKKPSRIKWSTLLSYIITRRTCFVSSGIKCSHLFSQLILICNQCRSIVLFALNSG